MLSEEGLSQGRGLSLLLQLRMPAVLWNSHAVNLTTQGWLQQQQNNENAVGATTVQRQRDQPHATVPKVCLRLEALQDRAISESPTKLKTHEHREYFRVGFVA